MGRRHTLILWLVGGIALFLVARPVFAAFVKLNDPLPPFGNVDTFAISPDSQYVVYEADQQTTDAHELYSVPLNGRAAPVRLSGLLPAGSRIRQYAIAPDNSRVVYLAEQDTTGVLELYSVPIDGSAASTKLNTSLVTGRDVVEFMIAPNGTHVIYLSDQQIDDVEELYRVPIAGGAVIKLNDMLVAGGDVLEFAVAPDSRYVVYLADQDSGALELYGVRIDTGDVAKLNGSPVPGGDVAFDFATSPDSSRVVYRADQQVDGVQELFVADLGEKTIRLQTAAVTVPEATEIFSITVVLNSPSVQPVTVDYAISGGTATVGEDVSNARGTLTIQPGSSTATFDLTIFEDTLPEEDETVELTLSNPINAVLQSPGTTIITIKDETSNPDADDGNSSEDETDAPDADDGNSSVYIPLVSL